MTKLKPLHPRGSFFTSQAAESVEHLHKEGLYRPVGVYIIQDERRRYLLTKSVKADVWSYPQGGIDLGESLEENMRRELLEEVGLRWDELYQFRFGTYYGKVSFSPDRVERRGFTKGKAYFFSSASCKEGVELTLQASEVAEAEWVDEDRLLKTLELYNDLPKATLLINATKANLA